MTVATGGDGVCHKYFLRGTAHKTKHKSALNFGGDEWKGGKRFNTAARQQGRNQRLRFKYGNNLASAHRAHAIFFYF